MRSSDPASPAGARRLDTSRSLENVKRRLTPWHFGLESPTQAIPSAREEKQVKGVSRRSAGLLVGVAVAAVAVAIAATGATARPAATQVCVLLPDTTTSVRWQQFDAPAFKAAFKKLGMSAAVVNALKDPQRQLAQAEQCISDGAKVGIITDLDRGTSI